MSNPVPLIFLSHSQSESSLALKLTNELSDAFLDGIDFFVSSDDKSIRVGDEWLSRIHDSLNRACIVLVLVSPDSVNRAWLNFEAGAAWLQKRKRLVPVCHSGITLKNLPQPLASFQGVDVCNPNDLRELFMVVGKAANLRTPEKDWKALTDALRLVCDVRLGEPSGAAPSWMFPCSEDGHAHDAMMDALSRCHEARLVGTGLNFFLKEITFKAFERKLRKGELTAQVCMGNRESPFVKQRIANEPPHHVSIDAWSGLITRLVTLKDALENPDRLRVHLFDHYPTYGMLIFDDEFFVYTYPYRELGYVSPCFYWRGGGTASDFYLLQFDRIFADSSPA